MLAPLLIIVFVIILLNNKYSILSFNEQTEKSIAVMPVSFPNENPGNQFICQAIQDYVKSNLSQIKDLTVLSEISTAKYQSTDLSVRKIGKELGVAHLLYGNCYQNGESFTVYFQLYNTKSEELEWSEPYNWTIQKIFTNEESEVAQTIARKLNVLLTNEEIERIGQIKSIDPTAYDFYQMGRNAHMEYWLDNTKQEALQKAGDFYLKALKQDPTYAQAYAGLARVAYDRTTSTDFFQESYLDTVLTLANKALSFDNTLSEAYTLLGDCYTIQKAVNAVEEYQNALKYDPNNWQAYYGLAIYYIVKDSKKTIQYSLEAAKRHRGPEYSIILNGLAFEFTIQGLFEEAKNFNQRKLEWDNDSVSYYTRLAAVEQYQGHFDKSIEYALKGYAIDSNSFYINGILGFNYILLHDYENSLLYYKKASDSGAAINYKGLVEYHRMGYVYLVNGDTIKAKEYFNRQIEASIKLLKSSQDLGAFYDLAATYAILNQKDKVFENLDSFRNSDEIPWFFYVLMKNDPLFQNLQNDTKFQQILEEIKDRATRSRNSLKTWFIQLENI